LRMELKEIYRPLYRKLNLIIGTCFCLLACNLGMDYTHMSTSSKRTFKIKKHMYNKKDLRIPERLRIMRKASKSLLNSSRLSLFSAPGTIRRWQAVEKRRPRWSSVPPPPTTYPHMYSSLCFRPFVTSLPSIDHGV
jgi:hypothetical protein